MSAAGDNLGAAIVVAQKAVRQAFVVPKVPTLADSARLVLLMAQAEGNAIAEAIASGRRIFSGTNPNPNPAQFQDGDIYFIREA